MLLSRPMITRHSLFCRWPVYLLANFTPIYVKWYCVQKIRFAHWLWVNKAECFVSSSWMNRIEIPICPKKEVGPSLVNSAERTKIQFLCIFFGWLSLLLDLFYYLYESRCVSFLCSFWIFPLPQSFDGKIQSVSDIYVFTFPNNVRVRYIQYRSNFDKKNKKQYRSSNAKKVPNLV